jgi:hypothetical protein
MLVFDTCVETRGEPAPPARLLRTVFHVDGDSSLKIDRRLCRAGETEFLLQAHLAWTDWCVRELRRAVAVPDKLRKAGWGALFVGAGLIAAGSVDPFFDIAKGAAGIMTIAGYVALIPARFAIAEDGGKWGWRLSTLLKYVPAGTGASTGLAGSLAGSSLFPLLYIVFGFISGPLGRFLAMKAFSLWLRVLFNKVPRRLEDAEGTETPAPA